VDRFFCSTCKPIAQYDPQTNASNHLAADRTTLDPVRDADHLPTMVLTGAELARLRAGCQHRSQEVKLVEISYGVVSGYTAHFFFCQRCGAVLADNDQVLHPGVFMPKPISTGSRITGQSPPAWQQHDRADAAALHDADRDRYERFLSLLPDATDTSISIDDIRRYFHRYAQVAHRRLLNAGAGHPEWELVTCDQQFSCNGDVEYIGEKWMYCREHADRGTRRCRMLTKREIQRLREGKLISYSDKRYDAA